MQSLKPGREIIVMPGAAVKRPGVISSAPHNVTVEYASTESDIVESDNAGYVRLTVTDHARPLDLNHYTFAKTLDRAQWMRCWIPTQCGAAL